MGGLIGWLKEKTVRVLDPEAEGRIEKAARDLEKMLLQQRDAFDVAAALEIVIAYPTEFPKIVDRAYQIFSNRAWRDDGMTPKKAAQLTWIAGKFGLTPQRQHAIDHGTGTKAFAECFRRSVENDGRLDAAEITRLKAIAVGMQSSPARLLETALRGEASRLFDDMLDTAMPGGKVDVQAWEHLCRTLGELSIDMPTFRAMVSKRAKAILEAALAESAADGVITHGEVDQLRWLARNLLAEDKGYVDYIFKRVDRMLLLQRISSGDLPSIRSHHAGIRAGEIVHLAMPTTYVRTRHLKSGDRQEQFSGTLVVTDARLMFISSALTHDVPHGRVGDVRPHNDWITLQCRGRGAGAYSMCADPTLTAMIYDVAVRRANQTIVQQVVGSPARHIPREIRQRVWQQYGGRCVDCGATEYIEFDHIVPVAKGGSNSEQNVQLLCRGCNGKKSDRI